MILSLELEIMAKFQFHLAYRSNTYWVDTLTALWDKHLQTAYDEADIHGASLYFRLEANKKNLSHLHQLIEKIYLDPAAYRFTAPTLVLSGMYLIIRMQLEEQKEELSPGEICERYRSSLNKSTNIIFYDKLGMN